MTVLVVAAPGGFVAGLSEATLVRLLLVAITGAAIRLLVVGD